MMAPHSISSASQQPCPECGGLLLGGSCAVCAFAALREERTGRPVEAEFGRYALRRCIARGGMGIVYEAADAELDRTVALKVLRSAAFAGAAELARFTLETRAAAALDHPHIVPVYEVGEEDGQPFFTMKLIRGQSLAERLHLHGPMPARQAAALLVPVARAVHHAHLHGVLHRDLKPGNILIDAAGKPWLTDFGLAKFSTSESTLTLTSDHIGTPHYMSPEMAAGRVRECSAACDVWALGVILWEMFSGRPPFMGGSAVEILRNIVEQEPLPPGELLRQNADLLTIARRCMEKRPADRPDGRWLAAGGEGAPACLWDLRAPDIAASRREAPAPAPLSGAVSFSPDNRRLAIGTGDGILHLWEWQNPDPAWNLTTLRTPEAIHTIAWLRDGRLLTGGAGPAVSLWEMEVAKLVQRARQTAGRELAPAERVRFGLGK